MKCKTCGKESKRSYCSGCEKIKTVSESNRPAGYSKPAVPTLTDDQWIEIYYALDSKRAQCEELHGDGEGKRWVSDLEKIMEIIGPDAKNMWGSK